MGNENDFLLNFAFHEKGNLVRGIMDRWWLPARGERNLLVIGSCKNMKTFVVFVLVKAFWQMKSHSEPFLWARHSFIEGIQTEEREWAANERWSSLGYLLGTCSLCTHPCKECSTCLSLFVRKMKEKMPGVHSTDRARLFLLFSNHSSLTCWSLASRGLMGKHLFVWDRVWTKQSHS